MDIEEGKLLQLLRAIIDKISLPVVEIYTEEIERESAYYNDFYGHSVGIHIYDINVLLIAHQEQAEVG
jgi:hypothetical protein